MKITFSDEVPQEVRKSLEWLLRRSTEVGIPCWRHVTCRPGTKPQNNGALSPEDRITYLTKPDELGNIHVTVETCDE